MQSKLEELQTKLSEEESERREITARLTEANKKIAEKDRLEKVRHSHACRRKGRFTGTADLRHVFKCYFDMMRYEHFTTSLVKRLSSYQNALF
jgi:predicted nuclease with TOPRIM domain